jgi:hypothetical protein
MANYIDEEVKKGNFDIWFKGKTELNLQESEKISIWRISSIGIQMLFCKDDHIKLFGEHKMNWFVGALTGGLIGDLFFKPLFAKDKRAELNQSNVSRIVISKGKTCLYHIFQKMEDGSTEVHIFQVRRSEHEPYLNERIRGYFSDTIIEEV